MPLLSPRGIFLILGGEDEAAPVPVERVRAAGNADDPEIGIERGVAVARSGTPLSTMGSMTVRRGRGLKDGHRQSG